MKILKTELLYYFSIFIILAVLQHSDLLVSPLTRFEQMQNSQNYLHPFLWSALLYIVIGMFRLTFKIIVYMKNKNKK